MIPLCPWECKDLWWFDLFLDKVTEIDIIDYCDPFLPEDEMHFDGATNGSRETGWCPGFGVWYKGNYIAAKIPEKYTNIFRSTHTTYAREFAIPHFEMIAIITGLHTFRHLLKRGSKLVLVTDSKHVEGIMKNKNSSDEFLQSCLRWLCMFHFTEKVKLYVIYRNTKFNKIPDNGSRFRWIAMRKLAERECKENGWTLKNWSSNFEIPDIHRW